MTIRQTACRKQASEHGSGSPFSGWADHDGESLAFRQTHTSRIALSKLFCLFNIPTTETQASVVKNPQLFQNRAATSANPVNLLALETQDITIFDCVQTPIHKIMKLLKITYRLQNLSTLERNMQYVHR
jgi:hypothetical protein